MLPNTRCIFLYENRFLRYRFWMANPFNTRKIGATYMISLGLDLKSSASVVFYASTSTLAAVLLSFAALAQDGSDWGGPRGSVDDLSAAIDKRLEEYNSFRELLNSPDPSVAYATLQILVELGDPALRRVALEHALYSFDETVRSYGLLQVLSSRTEITVKLDDETRVPNVDFSSLNWNDGVTIPLETSLTEGTCFTFNDITRCADRDGVALVGDELVIRFEALSGKLEWDLDRQLFYGVVREEGADFDIPVTVSIL